MLDPEYPLMLTEAKMKRSSYQGAFEYPSKRRKMNAQLDYEDHINWMDSFLLEASDTVSLGSPTDQEESFPSYDSIIQDALTASLGSPLAQEEIFRSYDFIKEALHVQDEFVSHEHFITETQRNPPDVDGWTIHSQTLQQTVAGASHQGENCDQLPRVITSSHHLSSVPTLASPSPSVRNPTTSHPTAQSVETPVGESSPAVDSGRFSISTLKYSKELTLLTLTSFPYRVMYCNEAFTKLSQRKASVIGDSVFDAFDLEGRVLRPNLANFPTLVGPLDNKVAFVPSSFLDNQGRKCWTRCGVQAYPVSKQDGSDALRYYAVRFTPL